MIFPGLRVAVLAETFYVHLGQRQKWLHYPGITFLSICGSLNGHFIHINTLTTFYNSWRTLYVNRKRLRLDVELSFKSLNTPSTFSPRVGLK